LAVAVSGIALAVVVIVPLGIVTAARPGPTPAVISGLYGPGIGMDALNNTPVGGPEATTTSYRFRAATSAALSSIRLYITDGAGYSSGDGGELEISVEPDDRSATHAPSGTTLASTTIRPGNPISIGELPLVTFPVPPILTSGLLYHIVFQNLDPSPQTNYVSLNGIYMYQPTSPRQPRFADLDWGQPTRSGQGSWFDQDHTVPILELDYADGTVQGEGHIQVWSGSSKVISGGASAREAFTVSGPSRTVSSVAVRLTRVSGNAALNIRLETSSGELIEQASVDASQIPIGIPGSHDGPGQATWAMAQLTAPRTLVSGEGYHLVLSAPSGTIYSIYVLRKGTEYHFSPETDFGDGHAQYNPGTGWVFFDQTGGQPNLDEGDLQFYFR
jgi:hypothetical protein